MTQRTSIKRIFFDSGTRQFTKNIISKHAFYIFCETCNIKGYINKLNLVFETNRNTKFNLPGTLGWGGCLFSPSIRRSS